MLGTIIDFGPWAGYPAGQPGMVFDDSRIPYLTVEQLNTGISSLTNFHNWLLTSQATGGTMDQRRNVYAPMILAMLNKYKARLAVLNALLASASARTKELMAQGLTLEVASAQAAREVADADIKRQQDESAAAQAKAAIDTAVAASPRAQQLISYGYTPENALTQANVEETARKEAEAKARADEELRVRQQMEAKARADAEAETLRLQAEAEAKAKIDAVAAAVVPIVNELVSQGVPVDKAIDAVSTETAKQITSGKSIPTWAIGGIIVTVIGGIIYIVKRKK